MAAQESKYAPYFQHNGKHNTYRKHAIGGDRSSPIWYTIWRYQNMLEENGGSKGRIQQDFHIEQVSLFNVHDELMANYKHYWKSVYGQDWTREHGDRFCDAVRDRVNEERLKRIYLPPVSVETKIGWWQTICGWLKGNK